MKNYHDSHLLRLKNYYATMMVMLILLSLRYVVRTFARDRISEHFPFLVYHFISRHCFHCIFTSLFSCISRRVHLLLRHLYKREMLEVTPTCHEQRHGSVSLGPPAVHPPTDSARRRRFEGEAKALEGRVDVFVHLRVLDRRGDLDSLVSREVGDALPCRFARARPG